MQKITKDQWWITVYWTLQKIIVKSRMKIMWWNDEKMRINFSFPTKKITQVYSRWLKDRSLSHTTLQKRRSFSSGLRVLNEKYGPTPWICSIQGQMWGCKWDYRPSVGPSISVKCDWKESQSTWCCWRIAETTKVSVQRNEKAMTYFASSLAAASRPVRPWGPTLAPSRRTGPCSQRRWMQLWWLVPTDQSGQQLAPSSRGNT